jgi:multimeric flavodoxin WrbA
MTEPDIRKGMPPVKLPREEFEKRYRSRFADPVFASLQRELDAIIAAAWGAYSHSRKSPVTRKAGPGFADPDYDIAVDWLAAREAIAESQRRHDDSGEAPRILIVNGSSRSEHTCPGEMSKTWRLVELAEPVFSEMGFAVDVLDLSRLTSEFGRQIHPCKSCVSTSMALCHWPCSCYPNYSLGQTDDWMNEIYPLWVAAHGIMIVTPVNWYHAPTPLKAMIDRLVCADGGNPDPTSTHGKKAAQAKAGSEGLAISPTSGRAAFRHRGSWRQRRRGNAAPFAGGLADGYVAHLGGRHGRGRRLYRLYGALRDRASRAGPGRGVSAASPERRAGAWQRDQAVA